MGEICVKSVSEHRCSFSWVQHTIKKVTKLTVFGIFCWGGEGYSAPKSLTLAPQDIPDISGYQLGFGCQCVKAYDNENHVINQKILQIRFVSNLDICKIVIVCPGQHHVKAQVWSFENVREKQK